MLEEQNRDLNKELEDYKERMEMDDEDRQRHILNLKKEMRDIDNQIQKSAREKEELQRQLNAIYDNVSHIVKLFKQSKFFLAVATKMDYDEGSGFTETNVTQYLAELEEYISSMITYAAFKKEEPHAAICAIPLDKLTKISDKKDIMAIDVPIANEIENDKIDFDELGIPQGKDEDVINQRDLLKKFEHMMKKGAITFITSSNKGPQHQQ